MSFKYSIQKSEDNVQLDLSGRLMEKSQAIEMLEEYEQLIEEGNKNFTLNLRELAYLNSSGLNILISMLSKARKAGGELMVSNLSDKVRELFLITKLNAVFTLVDKPDTTPDHLPVV